MNVSLGVLQEQDLDQPLEVDPARSAAVIEHLSAKRFLCARVVIGEQAPDEVRVARRDERKVRARQLALTTSCPRDVRASTRLRSHVRLQRTLLSYFYVPSWPMIRIFLQSRADSSL